MLYIVNHPPKYAHLRKFFLHAFFSLVCPVFLNQWGTEKIILEPKQIFAL